MVAIVIALVEGASRGDYGIGPVVTVVGLTIASALVLSWLIHRMPGSDRNTGASPFSRRRRSNLFGQPPDDPMDRPPRDTFGR